ncbi:hypothetical protein SEA_ALEEMILY_89 [Gordonia phage Aleemily]|uniref:Uncharacterized protein n=2 Tax=Cafassovirus TaxID=3425056 RepID=A0A9E7TYD7_9CAUD|nr:hypothetical protein SEA_CAFASSO_90 [Gordonia phage Cafasso]UVK59829.1 hypothetical protein SEA_ALEEMILY_89 [Gordonia phage Aleemily]
MSETTTIPGFEHCTSPSTAVVDYHGGAGSKKITGVTHAVFNSQGTVVLYRTTTDDKLDTAAIIAGGTYLGIYFDKPESETAQ